jgi:hypothetical protein
MLRLKCLLRTGWEGETFSHREDQVYEA